MAYPGGKGNVYQKIINLIPPHRVYVEAFAGGASVALNKRPAKKNILIDIDRDVIEAVATSVRDNHPFQRCNLVSPSSMSITPTESPTNMTMPTPIAICDGTSASSEETIRAFIADFDGGAEWLLICGNAMDFLVTLPADTFVYCDPPYLMETRRQHRHYYRHEFCTQAEHKQLLIRLLSLKCNVMVSGYDSTLYRSMLTNWVVESYGTQTRGNVWATEYLWMNYQCPVRLHDYGHLGANFRERDRIKRKKTRWVKKWRTMPVLERQAILSAIEEVNESEV